MRALSVATKGWIRSDALEVATAGRISPSLGIIIEYVCRNMEAFLSRALDIKAYKEKCR